MFSKLGKTLYLLILLIIIGACGVGGYEALATPGDQTPVTFPDKNLEIAIREALNKPEGPICKSDLESLTELNALGKGIANLTGLEHCINLQRLNLAANDISDLSPLSGLINLQSLYLGDSPVSYVSPLGGLTTKPIPALGGNQISDILPLAGLTNLRELYLMGNQIADISPLGGLINLRGLDLHENQIADISPLGGLINLRGLDLHENQIADISPLGGLINLQGLALSSNQISDISPLGGLVNLKTLWLSGNQISDILPLAELKNLQTLWLKGNQIADTSPLSELSALNTVSVGGNPLSFASANIYIPLIKLRGVRVEPISRPILPKLIIGAVLTLVAICILMTMRIGNWGLSRRVLQLSSIIIVGGFTYYLADNRLLTDATLLLTFFASVIVGFGTAVTFWSYRGRRWDLVGWSLIALAIVITFMTGFFVSYKYRDPILYVDLFTSPSLVAAGVLFLLRRVHLAIAITVSVLVLLVGLGFMTIFYGLSIWE